MFHFFPISFVSINKICIGFLPEYTIFSFFFLPFPLLLHFYFSVVFFLALRTCGCVCVPMIFFFFFFSFFGLRLSVWVCLWLYCVLIPFCALVIFIRVYSSIHPSEPSIHLQIHLKKCATNTNVCRIATIIASKWIHNVDDTFGSCTLENKRFRI